MLGITLGFPPMPLALALGAGEVFSRAPWLHGAVRRVGAAYRLWLAWRIATAVPAGPGAAGSARPMTFAGAAPFQWANPKAWAIALGAVAAHGTAAGAAFLAQMAALAGLFAAVTLPILSLWAVAGVGAARVLRTPRALLVFNRAMGGLLARSLVPLILSTLPNTGLPR